MYDSTPQKEPSPTQHAAVSAQAVFAHVGLDWLQKAKMMEHYDQRKNSGGAAENPCRLLTVSEDRMDSLWGKKKLLASCIPFSEGGLLFRGDF